MYHLNWLKTLMFEYVLSDNFGSQFYVAPNYFSDINWIFFKTENDARMGSIVDY
jgi:hypothetical protein